MTEDSRSGLDELVRNDLVLPEELIPELRKPLGRLVRGEKPALDLPDSSRIVTVGDQCTITLLGQGIKPDLAIVDYRTKREKIDPDPAMDGFDAVLKLRNPAGRISKGAWTVLKSAYDSGRSVRIDVDGEEDLLALPSIMLAPVSTTVIYGMPSQGLVVVKADERVKLKVMRFMKRMVVKGGD